MNRDRVYSPSSSDVGYIPRLPGRCDGVGFITFKMQGTVELEQKQLFLSVCWVMRQFGFLNISVAF